MCAQFFCCLCPVDGEWVGEIPQTEHSVGTEHQRADSETESNRQGDALRKRKGKEILEKFWIQEIFSQKCLKGFINIFFPCYQVHDIKAKLKQFKTDLHNCVGYIQDPKMLKETIKALYAKHVRDDIVST